MKLDKETSIILAFIFVVFLTVILIIMQNKFYVIPMIACFALIFYAYKEGMGKEDKPV